MSSEGAPGPPSVEQAPAAPGRQTSPYVGLRPYAVSESAIFFGRERERRIVSSNLVASRLTLLYGPSGVGKSSVLNAAVVPHLRALAAEQAGEDGVPAFTAVVFSSWRDDPIAGLRQCVSRLRRTEGAEMGTDGADASPDGEATLSEFLGAATARLGTGLLIVLDQFEEYFLYHGARAGDDRFAREFPDTVNDPGLPVNFLVSFREDALARLDLFKGRIPRLFANYLRIDYLDADGARDAILGPVGEYNRAHSDHPVRIEPALVDTVLEQVEAGKVVVGQAGAGTVEGSSAKHPQTAIETSHLQIVMARLWDEEVSARSTVLRRVTLDRLGGADEIVRRHLDRELLQLSDGQQEVAAAAFEHLVTPSGTKIAHSARDLAVLAHVSQSDLTDVLERLAAPGSRILRPVEPAPGRSDQRYEIFHDILAPAVLDWRARDVQQRERAAAEDDLRQQRVQADERARAARKRARNISIFSLVTALLVIAVVLALASRHERDLAHSRQRAAEAISHLSVDPMKSLREALSALDAAHTPEAETALRQAVAGSHVKSVATGHMDWVNAIAFDPHGKRFVTASQDHTARIWDVETSREQAVLDGHTNPVHTAVFSPSGDTVLTSSRDGTARLWDAATGDERRVLTTGTEPASPLLAASFDPSGTIVVTAGVDTVARLWDPSTGAQLRALQGHTGVIAYASFDASGTHVVTAASDGTARVWDAATGEQLALFDRHQGLLHAVFGPDGSLVGTAGEDGNAYLWRWQTGESVLLSGHTGEVVSIQFDRGGDRVVTAGDTTGRVWDARTGHELARLSGHSDTVTDAQFSADGRRVATSGQEGSARVWDVATASSVAELRGHPEIVWDVAFSPSDDRVIATAGSDGTARIWELPEQLTLAHAGPVTVAELSHDGRTVLTSGDDGIAHIWDSATGEHEIALSGQGGLVASFSPDDRLVVTVDEREARIWDRAHGDAPLAVTPEVNYGAGRFMPSGDIVALADGDGSVSLWDWKTSAPPRRLTGYRGLFAITDMEISTDGKRVVTAGSDRVARIWDVETRSELATLRGHEGVLYSARFSHDGRFIVTSSADGTARIWDAQTGDEVGSFVAARALRTAAFDTAGTRVVAGGVDGTIWVWDVRSGQTLSVVPRHTGAVNSAVFTPDGGRIVSAGDDWTASIYTCETCADLAALRHQAEQRLRLVAEQRQEIVEGWALSSGDCYDKESGSYTKIVDCEDPHDSEVFAFIEHPAPFDAPFDKDELARYAREQCESKLFADYVGVPYPESEYKDDVSYWAPSEGSWDLGDRRITCVVRGDEKMSGSVRGTSR